MEYTMAGKDINSDTAGMAEHQILSYVSRSASVDRTGMSRLVLPLTQFGRDRPTAQYTQ